MSKHSFQEIASTKIEGYMQAVSDDGKVVIYLTRQQYIAFYFDGEDIVERRFLSPFSIIDKVEEKYFEEGYEGGRSSYTKVLTKLKDDNIIVYIWSSKHSKIAKVIVPLSGEDFSGQTADFFHYRVMDIDLHPVEDCLIVMWEHGVLLQFRDKGLKSIELSFRETSPQLLDGRVMALYQQNNTYLYLFTIEVIDGDEWLILQKKQQQTYGISYTNVIQNHISVPDDYFYEHFQIIDYEREQRLFGVVIDHIDEENNQRMKMVQFIHEDGIALNPQGSVTTNLFLNFAQGKQEIIFGDYIVDNADIHNLFLWKICSIPYQFSSSSIYFNASGEVCRQGYYDRVASWKNEENSTLMLLHTDKELVVTNGTINDQLSSFPAYTFSTKHEKYLIVDDFQSMKYLAWKREPSDVGSTEDSQEFPIAITILSICLGIFVILFIVACICWKKSKKAEPDNKPESDLRINPYLNRSQPKHTTNPSKETKSTAGKDTNQKKEIMKSS